MGFLSKIASVALPVAGGIFGGPAGAAAGASIAGALGSNKDKAASNMASTPEAQARIRKLMEELAAQTDSPYQGIPMAGISRDDLDPTFGSRARVNYAQQKMASTPLMVLAAPAADSAPDVSLNELQGILAKMRGSKAATGGLKQYTLASLSDLERAAGIGRY